MLGAEGVAWNIPGSSTNVFGVLFILWTVWAICVTVRRPRANTSLEFVESAAEAKKCNLEASILVSMPWNWSKGRAFRDGVILSMF